MTNVKQILEKHGLSDLAKIKGIGYADVTDDHTLIQDYGFGSKLLINRKNDSRSYIIVEDKLFIYDNVFKFKTTSTDILSYYNKVQVTN